MNLAEEIKRVIQEQDSIPLSKKMREQQQRIDAGIQIYEELVSKGWIEPKSYRLAPVSTLPSVLSSNRFSR